MLKKYFLYAASAIFSLSSIAQATLVEEKTFKPGEAGISYKKFTYPNGLTLIVHEDHSDPVVHLNVTYHVGSARELPGKSGFAHLFEHMLFQGSKHVKDEEHFSLISRYGGNVNGNTTRDRTVYIETFPSNFTELGLWMEADRMGCFLDAFSKKKFEIQRATVKNEKDQGQSGPYGFFSEVQNQNFYPTDHPYNWPVIGYIDDLNRADSNDLKNFFLRWYGPNNACVIVAGDVNTDEVTKWVEKYFGSIQPGPRVSKQRVKPHVLTSNTSQSYNDYNAYFPLISTSFVGVPAYHPDEAPLEILSVLLGGSRKSPLYKGFVENELALGASANANSNGTINHELAGDFVFYVQGFPGSSVSELKDALTSIIDSFEYYKITDDELEKIKNNIISNYNKGFEDVSTKANSLSTYWYLNDNKMNLGEDRDRYAKVTKEDIMRVYRQYIKGKFSSTTIIMPGEIKDGEKPPKYVSNNPNAGFRNPTAEAEYAGLKLRPTVDNFDRSVRPTIPAGKTVTVPKLYRKTLSNGLEVIGTSSDESQEVQIQISMDGGHLLDKLANPNGTAAFTAAMLNQGTAKKTPQELDDAMEKLGASISISASTTSTNVYISCEKKNLDAVLALFQEMWFEPRWDKKEFKLLQKQQYQNSLASLNSRGVGSTNAFLALMYGNTPLGDHTSASDIASITLDNCKKYYESYYSPEITKIAIVGALSEEEAMTKLSFLEKWKRKDVVIPKPTEFPQFETSQIFGVEYIDAEQSDMIVGFKTLPYDATGEFFKSTIMNFALGGNFNCRINLNLREDKGWTYGSRGSYNAGYKDVPGSYAVQASIKANATDSAIEQTVKELKNYKEKGITGEEFQFTKQALLAADALKYETYSQKGNFLMTLALRNLPENYPQMRREVLDKITQEEINELAKKNLDTDKMVILVAGDMLLLKDRLDNLGYGKVQMLGKDGKGKYKVYKASDAVKHKKNHK